MLRNIFEGYRDNIDIAGALKPYPWGDTAFTYSGGCVILTFRLFNYGVGIHLLKDEVVAREDMREQEINSRADHISFQVSRWAAASWRSVFAGV